MTVLRRAQAILEDYSYEYDSLGRLIQGAVLLWRGHNRDPVGRLYPSL